MAGPSCHNCIYSVCDPEVWLRLMRLSKPVLPTCANHPQWPAQLHEVPGVPCKNYRRKPIAPQGDVRLIPLADGLYAYVDAADYEWLGRWNWHMASGGYAGRTDKGKAILMHREIMQAPKGMVVDHQDGNKANNCRFNLRICTQQENRRNARKQRGGRSVFKGVYYHKHGKICAQFCFEGRLRWLGYFPDELEAAHAYDRAAVEAFGEFARPNFPHEWPPQRRRQVHAKRQAALKKERRRDTHKIKAKGNKKKAKATRKPHPARRKTKKSPQRKPKPQSRRNRR